MEGEDPLVPPVVPDRFESSDIPVFHQSNNEDDVLSAVREGLLSIERGEGLTISETNKLLCEKHQIQS